MKYLLLMLSIFCILTFSAINVNAWPYQLNLTTGVLYDTNTSNNATANMTIYVVNVTYILQNITNISYFNQTFINQTCYNCTNITNYNYTYHYNGTNGTFYNASEIDTRFLTQTEFTAYKTALVYPTRAEFDNLITRVNNISIVPTEKSHTSIWATMVMGWLLVGVVIYFLVVKSGGSYETLS